MSKEMVKIDSKTLNQVAFRWLCFNTSAWNWERMQHLAFAYSLFPALKKIYPAKEDLKNALQRHVKFFNTEPTIGSPLLGVTIALEQARAAGEPVDDETLDAIKSGLMGPLAALGDSLFVSTLNALVLSLAMGLAFEGNILGPIIFVGIFSVLNIVLITRGVRFGYSQGINIFTSKLLSQESIEKYSYFFQVLGLVMVGALSASFVSIITIFSWSIEESVTKLQTILDGFMPKILPFCAVLILWFLHDKKQVSIMKLLLLLVVVGVLAVFLGIV